MNAIQIILGFLLLDLLFGDPVYAWHPIRLYGRLLKFFEKLLRELGWNGRIGGFLLFLAMLASAEIAVLGVHAILAEHSRIAADLWFVYIGYTHIAIRDLLRHGGKVAEAIAEDDLPEARKTVSMMVGRDVDRLDMNGCGRACVESLAENLTDGVIAPLLFYAVLGIPGMVFFKVVSTMDSMVGYKNEKYLRFGWFGAKLDDVLNYIPARLSMPMIAISAIIVRHCSFLNALKQGFKYHAHTSSPNSGWSEAGMAGALKRRLGGPAWYEGVPGKGDWIGDDEYSPEISSSEIQRTSIILLLTSAQSAFIATAVILAVNEYAKPLFY